MTAVPLAPFGDVLALFRDRAELSRTEVMELTGLSRSTVNGRLTALADAGLIAEIGGGESTGGRPSSRFAFRADRAVVIAADIGATGLTVGVCDLAGEPLRHVSRTIDVWQGPEAVLAEVASAVDELAIADEVWGVGVGVPGPVEFAAGRVVNPPIMTGWDGFDIAGWFGARWPVPVVVENDANARAVAEARAVGSDNLISLKLGTGVGSGLVFNGAIIRGSDGAAGDVGHTRSTAADDENPLPCRCGNLGCVEAYAGGWALRRDLDALGIATASVADLVEQVRRGQVEAVQAVRRAGRVLGDAVAGLVSVLNPATIVLSGLLADTGEVLLSGVRERVYQRAAPLATRNLEIRLSTIGELVGVRGLALVAADRVLAHEAGVDAA